MDNFNEAYGLMEEKFGKNKDNLISVATIALEKTKNGSVCPAVRCIDAIYEDGVFYCTTYANSNKMKQISQNPNVAVNSCAEMFTASAVAENLGWVMEAKNAEIRTKLRTAFAAWYDNANDEQDKNCIILAIKLERGILNINHWEKLYHMDFVNKAELKNAGII